MTTSASNATVPSADVRPPSRTNGLREVVLMSELEPPEDLARVREAVAELDRRLAAVDEDTRRRIPERSVLLVLTDVRREFHARLEGGRFVDLEEYEVGAAPKADARFTMTSQRLHDLLAGKLGFATAWATGRVRVAASPWVLLELRRFL